MTSASFTVVRERKFIYEQSVLTNDSNVFKTLFSGLFLVHEVFFSFVTVLVSLQITELQLEKLNLKFLILNEILIITLIVVALQ